MSHPPLWLGGFLVYTWAYVIYAYTYILRPLSALPPHAANVSTHVCDVFARIIYASTYTHNVHIRSLMYVRYVLCSDSNA